MQIDLFVASLVLAVVATLTCVLGWRALKVIRKSSYWTKLFLLNISVLLCIVSVVWALDTIGVIDSPRF